MFKAQGEAKDTAASMSKLEALAAKLKDNQEATARELVDYQTRSRETDSAMEKLKEKVAHYRAEAGESAGQLAGVKQELAAVQEQVAAAEVRPRNQGCSA